MAAGSGLSAAQDLTITNTILAKTGGYAGAGANWCALYTTQFTAAAKAGATEWTSASDTAPYARVAMGAAGAGWTLSSYISATGIQMWNTNTFNFTAVAGNAQTLFSVGFCDALTSGSVVMFSDLASSDPVAIGIQVQFNTTGSNTSDILFTTY